MSVGSNISPVMIPWANGGPQTAEGFYCVALLHTKSCSVIKLISDLRKPIGPQVVVFTISDHTSLAMTSTCLAIRYVYSKNMLGILNTHHRAQNPLLILSNRSFYLYPKKQVCFCLILQ